MNKIIFGRVPSFEEAIDLFVKPYQRECPMCGQAKKTCEECDNPTTGIWEENPEEKWIAKGVKNA